MESNDQHSHITQEQYKYLLSYIDAKVQEVISRIDSGFPGGDPVEHRKAHEHYIRETSERAALWKSIREKTITGIVWAGLMLVGSALWDFIKTALRGVS